MKRTITTMTAAVIFLSGAFGVIASAFVEATPQSPMDMALNTQIRQISAELKVLRLEVLQQGIELQSWKIEQAERELSPILKEQELLKEEEDLIRQQLTELEHSAESPTATQENMVTEAEVIKTALSENNLKWIEARRETLKAQASELSQRSNEALTARHNILKRIQSLQNDDRSMRR